MPRDPYADAPVTDPYKDFGSSVDEYSRSIRYAERDAARADASRKAEQKSIQSQAARAAAESMTARNKQVKDAAKQGGYDKHLFKDEEGALQSALTDEQHTDLDARRREADELEKGKEAAKINASYLSRKKEKVKENILTKYEREKANKELAEIDQQIELNEGMSDQDDYEEVKAENEKRRAVTQARIDADDVASAKYEDIDKDYNAAKDYGLMPKGLVVPDAVPDDPEERADLIKSYNSRAHAYEERTKALKKATNSNLTAFKEREASVMEGFAEWIKGGGTPEQIAEAKKSRDKALGLAHKQYLEQNYTNGVESEQLMDVEYKSLQILKPFIEDVSSAYKKEREAEVATARNKYAGELKDSSKVFKEFAPDQAEAMNLLADDLKNKKITTQEFSDRYQKIHQQVESTSIKHNGYVQGYSELIHKIGGEGAVDVYSDSTPKKGDDGKWEQEMFHAGEAMAYSKDKQKKEGGMMQNVMNHPLMMGWKASLNIQEGVGNLLVKAGNLAGRSLGGYEDVPWMDKYQADNNLTDKQMLQVHEDFSKNTNEWEDSSEKTRTMSNGRVLFNPNQLNLNADAYKEAVKASDAPEYIKQRMTSPAYIEQYRANVAAQKSAMIDRVSGEAEGIPSLTEWSNLQNEATGGKFARQSLPDQIEAYLDKYNTATDGGVSFASDGISDGWNRSGFSGELGQLKAGQFLYGAAAMISDSNTLRDITEGLARESALIREERDMTTSEGGIGTKITDVVLEEAQSMAMTLGAGAGAGKAAQLALSKMAFSQAMGKEAIAKIVSQVGFRSATAAGGLQSAGLSFSQNYVEALDAAEAEKGSPLTESEKSEIATSSEVKGKAIYSGAITVGAMTAMGMTGSEAIFGVRGGMRTATMRDFFRSVGNKTMSKAEKLAKLRKGLYDAVKPMGHEGIEEFIDEGLQRWVVDGASFGQAMEAGWEAFKAGAIMGTIGSTKTLTSTGVTVETLTTADTARDALIEVFGEDGTFEPAQVEAGMELVNHNPAKGSKAPEIVARNLKTATETHIALEQQRGEARREIEDGTKIGDEEKVNAGMAALTNVNRNIAVIKVASGQKLDTLPAEESKAFQSNLVDGSASMEIVGDEVVITDTAIKQLSMAFPDAAGDLVTMNETQQRKRIKAKEAREKASVEADNKKAGTTVPSAKADTKAAKPATKAAKPTAGVKPIRRKKGKAFTSEGTAKLFMKKNKLDPKTHKITKAKDGGFEITPTEAKPAAKPAEAAARKFKIGLTAQDGSVRYVEVEAADQSKAEQAVAGDHTKKGETVTTTLTEEVATVNQQQAKPQSKPSTKKKVTKPVPAEAKEILSGLFSNVKEGNITEDFVINPDGSLTVKAGQSKAAAQSTYVRAIAAQASKKSITDSEATSLWAAMPESLQKLVTKRFKKKNGDVEMSPLEGTRFLLENLLTEKIFQSTVKAHMRGGDRKFIQPMLKFLRKFLNKVRAMIKTLPQSVHDELFFYEDYAMGLIKEATSPKALANLGIATPATLITNRADATLPANITPIRGGGYNVLMPDGTTKQARSRNQAIKINNTKFEAQVEKDLTEAALPSIMDGSMTREEVLASNNVLTTLIKSVAQKTGFSAESIFASIKANQMSKGTEELTSLINGLRNLDEKVLPKHEGALNIFNRHLTESAARTVIGARLEVEGILTNILKKNADWVQFTSLLEAHREVMLDIAKGSDLANVKAADPLLADRAKLNKELQGLALEDFLAKVKAFPYKMDADQQQAWAKTMMVREGTKLLDQIATLDKNVASIYDKAFARTQAARGDEDIANALQLKVGGTPLLEGQAVQFGRKANATSPAHEFVHILETAVNPISKKTFLEEALGDSGMTNLNEWIKDGVEAGGTRTELLAEAIETYIRKGDVPASIRDSIDILSEGAAKYYKSQGDDTNIGDRVYDERSKKALDELFNTERTVSTQETKFLAKRWRMANEMSTTIRDGVAIPASLNGNKQKGSSKKGIAKAIAKSLKPKYGDVYVEEFDGKFFAVVDLPKLPFNVNPVEERALFQTANPKQDAAYMKAVESGDVAKQQEMVDAAAKNAGHSERGLHSTWIGDKEKPFDVFNFKRTPSLKTAISGWGVFFSPNHEVTPTQDMYAFMSGQNKVGGKARHIKAWLKMENPKKVSRDDFYKFMDWGSLDTQEYKNLAQAKKAATAYKDNAVAQGHDGLLIGDSESVVFSPNQIKSADPVTYDDQGNVVPLSKRFDKQSDDIRFQTTKPINKPSPQEKAVRSVSDTEYHIYRKFKDAFKTIGVAYNTVPFGVLAEWTAGKQGSQIHFNSKKLSHYSDEALDLIVREELIHAASYKIITESGVDYNAYHKELYEAMVRDGFADKFSKVYKSNQAPINQAAEFKRAAIQKILYGIVTEQEMRTDSFQIIAKLIKGIADFFKKQIKTLTGGSRNGKVFEDTVAMMRKTEETLATPYMQTKKPANIKTETKYQVYDSIDKKPVGKPYKNRNRARTRVDTLDGIYGAYRYQVNNVEVAVEPTGENLERAKMQLIENIDGILVYHGGKDFVFDVDSEKSFSDKDAILASGFNTTTSRNEALKYGKTITPFKIKPENMLEVDSRGAFSTLTKYEKSEVNGSKETSHADFQRRLQKVLIRKGYDGVTYKVEEGDKWHNLAGEKQEHYILFDDSLIQDTRQSSPTAIQVRAAQLDNQVNQQASPRRKRVQKVLTPAQKKVADLKKAKKKVKTTKARVKREHPDALPLKINAAGTEIVKVDYGLINSPFLKQVRKKDAANVDELDYDNLHYVVGAAARKKIARFIKSGSMDAAVDSLVAETTKMMEYADVASGHGWYSRMREKLQNVFGDRHELFANILGVTSAKTDVETNFTYAVDVLEQLDRGDFDRHIKSYNEMRELAAAGKLVDELLARKIITKKKFDAGLTSSKAFDAWIDHYDIKPKKSNGSLYGSNSGQVLKAIAGTWMKESTSPKTPQFSKNLFGSSMEATIDIWAARTLRRIMYADHHKKWRIDPSAETGVSDSDFAVGQIVFREAAKRMGMNPDDLQAIVWFGEKHVWDDAGWTGTAGGLKSSFDEAAEIFFPKEGRARTHDEGSKIISFLKKERLIIADKEIDLTILATNSPEYKNHIKLIRGHKKDYEKAKQFDGLKPYLEQRGRDAVLPRSEGEPIRKGARPNRNGQSNRSGVHGTRAARAAARINEGSAVNQQTKVVKAIKSYNSKVTEDYDKRPVVTPRRPQIPNNLDEKWELTDADMELMDQTLWDALMSTGISKFIKLTENNASNHYTDYSFIYMSNAGVPIGLYWDRDSWDDGGYLATELDRKTGRVVSQYTELAAEIDEISTLIDELDNGDFVPLNQVRQQTKKPIDTPAAKRAAGRIKTPQTERDEKWDKKDDFDSKGKKVIRGNPKQAKVSDNMAARNAEDVLQDLYKENYTAQEVLEWNAEAAVLTQDPLAVEQAIYEIADGGDLTVTAGFVIAASRVVADKLQAAMVSGNAAAINEAQVLGFAHQESRANPARLLRAMRDPFQTPQQRAAYALGTAIHSPSNQVAAALKKKFGAKQNSKGQYGAVPQENKAAYYTKLAEIQTQRYERAKVQLEKDGFDIKDIFNAQDEGLAVGTTADTDAQSNLTDKQKQILKLLREGADAKSVKIATGVDAKGQQKVMVKFKAEAEKQARKLVERGYRVDTMKDYQADKPPSKMPENPTEAEMGQAVKDIVERSFRGGENRAKTFNILDPRDVMAAFRSLEKLDEDWVTRTIGTWYANVFSAKTVAVNLLSIPFAGYRMVVDRGAEAALNAYLKNPDAASVAEYKYLKEGWKEWWAMGAQQALIAFDTEHAYFQKFIEGGTAANPYSGESSEEVRGYQMGHLLDYVDEGLNKIGLGKYLKRPATVTRLLGGKKTKDFKLGKLARGVLRFNLGVDEFMRYNIAGAEVSAIAYREGKKQSLTGEELKRFIRIETRTAGSKSWEKAGNQADISVFTEELPKFENLAESAMKEGDILTVVGDGMAAIVNAADSWVKNTDKVMKARAEIADGALEKTVEQTIRLGLGGIRITVMPFTRVLMNLIRKGFHYVPNPIVTAITGYKIAKYATKHRGESDPEAAHAIHRFSSQIVSSILATVIYSMAEGDEDDDKKDILITGSMDKFGKGAKEKRDAAMAEGMGAFHIRVGDMTFDYGRIDPFAITIGTTVDTIRNIKKTKRGDQGMWDWTQDFAANTMLAQMTDKTMLRGINDIFMMMGEKKRPEKWAARQLATFLVPNLLRQPIRDTNEFYGESGMEEKDMEGFARILGSEMFPQADEGEWLPKNPLSPAASRDAFGEKGERPDHFGKKLPVVGHMVDWIIKPKPFKKIAENEAVRAFQKKHPHDDSVRIPTKNSKTFRYTDPRTKEKFSLPMTNKQFDIFSTLYRNLAKHRPRLKRGDEGAQSISKTRSKLRTLAINAAMLNPTFMKDAKEQLKKLKKTK